MGFEALTAVVFAANYLILPKTAALMDLAVIIEIVEKLKTTVTELKELMQETHRKENSSEQQFADLQSDLQDQKTLIQKLQADLNQVNQLKAELEQAKKVILQLAEVNSKLTQEVDTLRKENEGFKSQKLGLKKLPHQSMQPNSSSIRISNTDIGWVD